MIQAILNDSNSGSGLKKLCDGAAGKKARLSRLHLQAYGPVTFRLWALKGDIKDKLLHGDRHLDDGDSVDLVDCAEAPEAMGIGIEFDAVGPAGGSARIDFVD